MADEIEISLTETNTGISQTYVDNKVAQEVADRNTAIATAKTETEAEITAEAEKRASSDSGLNFRLTAVEEVVNNYETAIETEKSEREKADSELNAVIKANKEDAESKMTALDTKITTKETECISRLNTEIADRKTADANLSSKIDSAVTGALKYQGTVATTDYLPQAGQKQGDMWNVEADGMNYAWTGYKWDSLGAIIDLTPIKTDIATNASNISNEATARATADSELDAKIADMKESCSIELQTEEACNLVVGLDDSFQKITASATLSGGRYIASITATATFTLSGLEAGNYAEIAVDANGNSWSLVYGSKTLASGTADDYIVAVCNGNEWKVFNK